LKYAVIANNKYSVLYMSTKKGSSELNSCSVYRIAKCGNVNHEKDEIECL